MQHHSRNKPDPNPDPIAGQVASPGSQADALRPMTSPSGLRPVATVWCGGVPESVRTASARPAALASGDDRPATSPAGKGFDRFWLDTCRYWASRPDSQQKK